jgi:hypothetical protein
MGLLTTEHRNSTTPNNDNLGGSLKILAVHGIGLVPKEKEKAVDLWRIARPIRELRKHVDWQIDEQATFIPGIEKYKDSREFTAEELDRAAEKLGEYDIIWSIYFTNPTFYTLLRVVQEKYGTKFIMDVDDDLFAIKQDNPIWLKLTHENVYHMQCMVRDVDYITTTTDKFARTLREKRKDKPADSVMVVPNLIPDDYKHDPIDNNGQIIIGYFGGSSHIHDIDRSGMVEAVEKIMHENKNVRFVACGMPIEKYLPKGRYSYHEGMPGTDWVDKVFPSLNFDIAVAPLEPSIFADGKSNIKWLESTRMGAVFVGTNTGPYKTLRNGFNAVLVANSKSEWYKALKELVEDADKRKKLVETAQKDIEKFRLETKGKDLAKVFEKVAKPSLILTS